MKVKILLVPLALVLSLGLCVWFVFPAYHEMRNQMNQLKKEKLQLSDLTQKEEKVKVLMSSLNENADKQSLVLKFLPDIRKEEEIIKNLNEIVTQEGLSVSNISVHKPKTVVEEAIIPEIEQSSESLVLNSAPKINKFEVSLNIAGEYEKINNAMNKINALKRYNEVSGLKISKILSEKDTEATNNLKANFTLDFVYMDMEKIESIEDTNNPIFTTGKFNLSAIEKIQKLKNTEVLSVSLDATGKNNPFLP